MAHEIELKLALGESGPAQLHRHPLLIGQDAQLHEFINIYFDTPSRTLEKERIALRLRSEGDAVRQTVKTAGSGQGGLHTRGEWEWDVSGHALDFTGLRGLPLATFQDEALLNALQPAYRTDFKRVTWLIKHGDATIELALDQGEVIAGERRCAIRELELELKEGEQSALWTLAEMLTDSVALRPANMSKAARAVALRDNTWDETATVPAQAQPATQQPLLYVEHAITALDAYTDTNDEQFIARAREAFAAVAQHDETAIAQPAASLHQALTGKDWLTPAFGKRFLSLLAQLASRSQ
ncbi:CYTH domain-containing protein [Phytohalomonas tamaricis]|uniref:CYTH domain-containing protein n=1 Tax=Phytohalomonas tamaricis TaxID=2081032 RepID=UPI000D0AFE9D|nr:CYTH domain-containing protein [Phytohalomonas tamaricis]